MSKPIDLWIDKQSMTGEGFLRGDETQCHPILAAKNPKDKSGDYLERFVDGEAYDAVAAELKERKEYIRDFEHECETVKELRAENEKQALEIHELIVQKDELFDIASEFRTANAKLVDALKSIMEGAPEKGDFAKAKEALAKHDTDRCAHGVHGQDCFICFDGGK